MMMKMMMKMKMRLGHCYDDDDVCRMQPRHETGESLGMQIAVVTTPIVMVTTMMAANAAIRMMSLVFGGLNCDDRVDLPRHCRTTTPHKVD